MLHKETIETSTLELLKKLQCEPLLASFNLVGGTSLALRLGHRKSVDLDLFSKEDFNLQEIKELLVNQYGFKVGYEKGKTLKFNSVMDAVNYLGRKGWVLEECSQVLTPTNVGSDNPSYRWIMSKMITDDSQILEGLITGAMLKK